MRPGVIPPGHTYEDPMEVFVWNQRTISRSPPIVIDYCSTPRSGRVEWPCGYRSNICNGESLRCQRCRFNYCEKHFATHARRDYIPLSAWRKFRKSLGEQLRLVVTGEKKRMRLEEVDLGSEAME